MMNAGVGECLCVWKHEEVISRSIESLLCSRNPCEAFRQKLLSVRGKAFNRNGVLEQSSLSPSKRATILCRFRQTEYDCSIVGLQCCAENNLNRIAVGEDNDFIDKKIESDTVMTGNGC